MKKQITFIDYRTLRQDLTGLAGLFENKIKDVLSFFLSYQQRSLLLISNGRIKSLDGINKKLLKKKLNEISDLIGFRIIVPTRSHVVEITKILLSIPGYTLVEKILYTNDLTHKTSFQSIGFIEAEIQTKSAGYVGVHLVFYKNDDPNKHNIELQIRTHLEHGLFEVDHPIYKAKDELGPEIESMRAALVTALEGVAAMQESLIDICRAKKIKLGQLNLQPNIENLPPIGFVGQLIKLSTDPKIYLVTDVRTIRYTKYNGGASEHLSGNSLKHLKVHIIADKNFVQYSLGSDIPGSPRPSEDELIVLSEKAAAVANEIYDHYNLKDKAL